jgi:ABC-type uncharacterized transport system permease subunit
VLVPLAILTAVLVGGAWGAIPGLAQGALRRARSHHTIMMNFIAVALVSYFTQYHYKAPGDPIMQSVPIGAAAHIPASARSCRACRSGIPLNVAFLLAILACALVYVFCGARSGATRFARRARTPRPRSTAA